MSLRTFMDMDVVILDPVLEEDAHGNMVPSGDFTERAPIKGWVAQLSGQELIEPGRLANLTTWEGLLPAGTDIDSDNELMVDDVTYLIDGPPNHVRRPGRGAWYIHLKLRRVSG